MLFQVSRQHVQAVSVLLYFLTCFLCLAFCFIYLMDLEHWHPFVLKFPESACLLQPGPGTSSKHRPEHGTKKTPETRKARGYLRGNRTFTLLNICGPARAGLGTSNRFKQESKAQVLPWARTRLLEHLAAWSLLQLGARGHRAAGWCWAGSCCLWAPPGSSKSGAEEWQQRFPGSGGKAGRRPGPEGPAYSGPE